MSQRNGIPSCVLGLCALNPIWWDEQLLTGRILILGSIAIIGQRYLPHVDVSLQAMLVAEH
jgi:hypothetical protein